MKTYEFKLPDIGEGVTEGEIVKWLIAPGDPVAEDQPIVEVMTDKATVTITSPRAGKVLETRGAEGGVVPVHAVLVVFDVSEGASAGQDASAAASASGPAATAVGDIKESLPGMNLTPPTPSAANGKAEGRATSYFNDKPLATPATRALARELGVDLRIVEPTGPAGRVTKEDVRSQGSGRAVTIAPGPVPVAADAGAPLSPTSAPMTSAPLGERFPRLRPAVEEAPRPAAPVAAETGGLPLPPPTARRSSRDAAPPAQGAPLEERIPLRGLRKRIFEGMTRSKHTAAHFTFVEECDVSALKALRARLRPAAQKAGVKLTFLPFFVKAVVAALKRHPTLNAMFDEATQEIVVRRYYDIGIASATESGLIVPVVRHADRKSLLDIARDIGRLGEETKVGKVRPEDLGGSTFTITSLGQQGGLFATPILNFPEVGILGIHQMKQKPVVRDGQIVVGDVMLLSLSFDHRIIDGHVGAAFAYEIIGYLEDPDRLFLEMA
jgi:pyruvate dehydrogenase E2 component (dihydrolipoamide acetyltransferase)